MKQLVQTFYNAFNNLDAKTMANCYHDEVVFEDPAFGVLKGNHAKNMWLMLCESQKGKDFKIIYSNIEADHLKGTAHWEAFYIFSKTGRKVHNVIQAHFEFKDGKIIKHTDVFDVYKWSKQAFGLTGFLLGWTRFFKSKLQLKTNRLLKKFEDSINQ